MRHYTFKIKIKMFQNPLKPNFSIVIEKIIIHPPITTAVGGTSLINNQAHKGPKTDSVNIITPTIAAGVV